MILEILFVVSFTASILCLCIQNMHTQKQINIIKDDNIKFKFHYINEDDVNMLDILYKRMCMMRN